ncbi:hypothetical protein LOTGIDRAFT_231717 [Lottia gigantea]|uniref:Uncharacterized protein n=1 Tax=Lottia gigantea TaxID=225164 RepID=V4AT75_LOTGI|nr:hypothetical protein LOTGIDRAFT_231717 [Lottia gigantea]ESO96916.1 hypothetical protein LOTGIDRAFT_231717 [Lottia gigantea]
MLANVVSGQLSGCPLYGCTPSGSFSLNKVVISPDIKVAWTAQIDNSSHTSNIDNGCVSNGNNLVCPTSNGYVSLDPTNGKELWRTKNLLRPTLPILDIYGDVIGCDGPSLVKIDSDGRLEPIIHLDLPLDSIYSLNLMTESNALVIVSRSGMVVAYLTNGVPLASLQLNGTSDGQKGTFHPIASPVISGQRVYVLTEFSPASTNGRKKNLKDIRLYALDITDSITDRIHAAWFMDIQKELIHFQEPKKTETNINLKLFMKYNNLEKHVLRDGQLNATFRITNIKHEASFLSEKCRTMFSSVLIESDIVYVSLSSTRNSYKASDKSCVPILIAINDTVTQGQILFKNLTSISHLASVPFTSRSPGSPGSNLYDNQLISHNIIWGNNETHFLAFDSKTGRLVLEIDVSQLFKTRANVTSNLIVSISNDSYTLTFGVATNFEMPKYFLTAIAYDLKIKTHKVLYKVECTAEVTGQIISTIDGNGVQMMTSSPSGYVTAFKKQL